MPSSDSGDSHLLNYSTYLLLENKTMTRLPLREVVYMGAYMWVPSGSVVKNLPATQGSIPELGRSPEEGMATHSSILAWRIPWTEEPGGLWSIRSQRVVHHRSDLACIQTLKTPHFQCRGHRFDPMGLVGELRTHMLCGMAKKFFST